MILLSKQVQGKKKKKTEKRGRVVAGIPSVQRNFQELVTEKKKKNDGSTAVMWDLEKIL